MSVVLAPDQPKKYAPVIRNRQLFVAIKDRIIQSVFLVNHDEYYTASAFLTQNPDHHANRVGWDFVRSATEEEAAYFMEEQA